jgi:hypothetical protein
LTNEQLCSTCSARAQLIIPPHGNSRGNCDVAGVLFLSATPQLPLLLPRFSQQQLGTMQFYNLSAHAPYSVSTERSRNCEPDIMTRSTAAASGSMGNCCSRYATPSLQDWWQFAPSCTTMVGCVKAHEVFIVTRAPFLNLRGCEYKHTMRSSFTFILHRSYAGGSPTCGWTRSTPQPYATPCLQDM